jgi:hypothetical protein
MRHGSGLVLACALLVGCGDDGGEPAAGAGTGGGGAAGSAGTVAPGGRGAAGAAGAAGRGMAGSGSGGQGGGGQAGAAVIPSGPNVTTTKLMNGGGWLSTATDVHVMFGNGTAMPRDATVYIEVLDNAAITADLGGLVLLAAFDIGPSSVAFQGNISIEANAPRPLVDANGDYDVPAYGFAYLEGGTLSGLGGGGTEILYGDEPQPIMSLIDGEISGTLTKPGRVLLLRDDRARFKMTRAADSVAVGSGFEFTATAMYPAAFTGNIPLLTFASSLEADPEPAPFPETGGTAMTRVTCKEAADDASYSLSIRFLNSTVFGSKPLGIYSFAIRREFTCGP